MNYIVAGVGYIGFFEQYKEAYAMAQELINGQIISIWGLTG